ncbi:MAG TPA: IclR family transcriptional regulator [Acidimicrobiales bacterium]|nr:IclR family transcriptional regulator [Acidimicrobiales bacterium]
MTVTTEARVRLDPNSVLARAGSILDAFDGAHPVLSLSELAARTGLPKSTVHRFAEQLLVLGWFERASGGYRVGMRLFEVGGLADRRNRLRDKALVHLQTVASVTGCAAHLAVLDAGEVVYLEKLPIRGLTLPTRDGGRMPAHCTALGKVMLAYAGTEEIERVIAAGLESRTERTIVDAAALREELAQVRRRGVAYDREEACRGVACVAAPIRGSGRAVAAVSATGFSDGFDFSAIENAVRRASLATWDDLFGPARHAEHRPPELRRGAR